MDPEVKFYLYNRYLPRFLLLATGVFFLVLGFLWWQENRSTEEVVVLPTVPIHTFSARATETAYISNYVNQSRIIHDAEAIPAVRELFFTREINTPNTDEEIQVALAEIKSAQQSSSTASALHVRSTSYYIGNLLILPGLTLHHFLTPGTRQATSRLIDTALADTRAATVKLQRHFDVAPPAFYDQQITSQLTYHAASFPSLTVPEVATVLTILASINPTYARLYEEQLRAYLADVLTSGSHWAVDIEYGLKLAQAMVAAMRESQAYSDLFTAAQAEWTEPTVAIEHTYEWRPVPYSFFYTNLAYQSNFLVQVTEYDPVNSEMREQEELSGYLTLSLLDERLPESTPRLYVYGVEADSFLPAHLNLTVNNYPFLGTGISQLKQTSNRNRKIALSGKPTPIYNTTAWYRYNKVVYIEEGQVQVLDKLFTEQATNFKELEWQPETEQILLVGNSEKAKASEVFRVQLRNNATKPVESIGVGTDAVMLDADLVVVERNGLLYLWSKDWTELRLVTEIKSPTATTLSRSIRYFADASTLLVLDRQLETSTLLPNSVVSLYQWLATEQKFVLSRTVNLEDGILHDAVLSPQGRYVGLAVTIPGGEDRARLLLFDTISGIIKKELLLEGFDTRRISLDEWLTTIVAKNY